MTTYIRRLAIRACFVFVVASCSAIATAGATDASPVGDELVINSYTTGNQGYPAVSIDAAGDFVVVWESWGVDGSAFAVAGQRFASDGARLGGELQVNSYTTGDQWEVAATSDPDGGFVVSWNSVGQDGNLGGIFAQRYDAAGQATGGELQVSSYTADEQAWPAVAVHEGGNMLVLWESNLQDFSGLGVYGQLFDSSGTRLGDEFRVNDDTAGGQDEVVVTAVDDGFLVVWESALTDLNQDGAVWRLLDSSAAPTGPESVANTFTFGNQEDVNVAALDDGTFAIVWEDDVQDASGEAVIAQVFDASGSKIGGELQLNSYTTADQEDPAVAPDGVGGFVAVWESNGQIDTTTEEVFGRRFGADGSLVGAEFQVNTQATYDQKNPDVAGRDGHGFLVVWQGHGGLDGDQAGVFGQIFGLVVFNDGFESGDTGRWSASIP